MYTCIPVSSSKKVTNGPNLLLFSNGILFSMSQSRKLGIRHSYENCVVMENNCQ